MCCIQYQRGGGTFPHCQSAGTSCYGPDVYCDGPEDCGSGQVCCATNTNNSIVIECRSGSSCQNGNQRVVCGNDVKACESGEACQPYSGARAYNVCE
jgi:hypothetical protein